MKAMKPAEPRPQDRPTKPPSPSSVLNQYDKMASSPTLKRTNVFSLIRFVIIKLIIKTLEILSNIRKSVVVNGDKDYTVYTFSYVNGGVGTFH